MADKGDALEAAAAEGGVFGEKGHGSLQEGWSGGSRVGVDVDVDMR